jgi:hypothetical protein
MKRLIWLILIPLIVGVIFFFIGRMREEYEKACWVSVNRDMLEISDGIHRWSLDHKGLQPSSLADLVPAFIAQETINRPSYNKWLTRQPLVPSNPYGITISNGTVLVVCAFLGNDFTQVVMNVDTKEIHIK